MRKKHSPAFKFKVAFEALSGKSIVEICQKYEIAASLVHKWKDHLKQNGIKVFGDEKIAKPMDWEREQAKLFQRIGELSTELDYLKKIVEG